MTHEAPSTRLRLAACGAALLAALVVAEIVARRIRPAADAAEEPGVTAPDGRVVSEPDLRLGWRLPADATIAIVDFEVHTNRFGTRGPAFSTAQDRVRVLCLGDSTVFGNHTDVPGQLRRVLRERGATPEVEVMNAGVPGYSSEQAVDLFTSTLASLRPDVVTLCVGMNDAQAAADGLTDRARAKRRRRAADRFRSRLLDLLRDPAGEDGAPPTDRVPLDDLRDNLERLVDACRARGARLLLLTEAHAYPSTADRPQNRGAVGRGAALDARNATVREFAAREGVALLDLRDRLAAEAAPEVFNAPYPGADSIHPNPLGARVIAEALATELIQRGWVPAARSADADVACGVMPTAAAVRLGDDPTDRLLMATSIGDRVELRLVDPRDESGRRIACDLPAPDAEVDVSVVPAWDGELLLTAPTPGGCATRSVLADGAPGRFAPRVLPFPVPTRVRVTAVDMIDDDAPEYVVTLDPVLPGEVLFLSDTFRPLARRAAGEKDGAPRAAVGHLVRPDRAAVITWSPQPVGALRLYDRWELSTLPSPLLHLRTQGTALVIGRFAAGDPLERLIAIRHAAVSRLEDGRWQEPWFPFGALRATGGVAPALAAMPGAGRARAVLASRRGDRVHLAFLEADGSLVPGPVVRLPASEPARSDR